MKINKNLDAHVFFVSFEVHPTMSSKNFGSHFTCALVRIPIKVVKATFQKTDKKIARDSLKVIFQTRKARTKPFGTHMHMGTAHVFPNAFCQRSTTTHTPSTNMAACFFGHVDKFSTHTNYILGTKKLQWNCDVPVGIFICLFLCKYCTIFFYLYIIWIIMDRVCIFLTHCPLFY